MNLLAAKKLARELMAEHGVADWRFEFDGGVKRFGICCYGWLGGPGTIGLSEKLTLLNSEERVRLVILHEIAHALVGSSVESHGAIWERKCREIGGDGLATYAYDSVTAVPGKWVATCPGCGRTVNKVRKPKREQSCHKCSSRFDRRFLLVYRENHGRDQSMRRLAAAANGPAPVGKATATKVDSHEYHATGADGRKYRLVRGWADTSERTWSVIDMVTGMVQEQTHSTIRAAKEAIA